MPEPLAQLQAAHHLSHMSVNVITHTEMLLFHPNMHSQLQCIGSCTQVTRKQGKIWSVPVTYLFGHLVI